jgi:tetratricopeptide (TPR) repeat protein
MMLMSRHADVLRQLGRNHRAEEVEGELHSAQAAIAAAPASTPDALTRRAEMRIRLGLFKDALADSSRAMELDPPSIMPWYYRGCLLAYLEDEPTYRAHCDAMLKHFERSGPREGERTAKTSLLLPGTPHLARLNEVLDRALAVDSGDLQAWDQLAKAMAEYRAGRFDACIDMAGKAADRLRLHNVDGSAAAELFAAMAHHRLGRHDRAAAILDEVARYVEQKVPKFGADKFGADFTVENWLILHVALREAEALIRAKPPATLHSGA